LVALNENIMMKKIFRGSAFNRVDKVVNRWMAENGVLFLRLSIGIIFLWFGMLKFFQGASPAEVLAINTIDKPTFSLLHPKKL